MKKIKNILKNNIKVIIGLMIGFVISGITVYSGTILYASNQVIFTIKIKKKT